MAPSTITPTTENESSRRRSLSGASALLVRRFTRQSSAPRPTSSRSESTTKRRATITAPTHTISNDTKVHVRIVPNIENPSRSLIFDIVDRELEVGSMIRIGRYSERHTNLNCMSFKSKVVSRCHSEVWVETDGKLYIRDTKSSSGTFLNHVRLSPAGNESRPVELNDGDIVQLGVDFQGGREEMYRSVKMRFELNRSSRPRPLSFSLNAFQNLRNLTHQEHHAPVSTSTAAAVAASASALALTPPSQPHTETSAIPNPTLPIHTLSNQENLLAPTTTHTHDTNNDIDECCICLYALAPFQALFVSPCSHTYHFKCIRPLLLSYPGFQCPICRTYSDLEASVAIEADEVMEKYAIHCNKKDTDAPPADSGLGLQSNHPSDIHHPHLQENQVNRVEESSCTNQPLEPTTHTDTHTNANSNNNIPLPLSTSFISPVIYSEPLPDVSPLNHDIENQVVAVVEGGSSLSNDSVEDNGIMSNTDGEEEEEEEQEEQSSRPRERRTSHIMEKIKMVFFEKRKSVASTTHGNHKNRRSSSSHPQHTKSRQRPSSFSEVAAMDVTMETNQGSSRRHPTTPSTGVPLNQTLSRQSTTHLTEINENAIVINSHHINSRERNPCIQQAMTVDV